MKRAVIGLAAACCFAAHAEPMSLSFDRMPVATFLRFFYSELEKRPVVIDGAVEKSDLTVSLSVPSIERDKAVQLGREALSRLGVQVERAKSVDWVSLSRAKDARDQWKQLVYTPRNRDAMELVNLSHLVVRQGKFAHERAGVAATDGASGQAAAGASNVPETGSNGASVSGKAIDRIVFAGPVEEVAALESLLERLDTVPPQVEIRAGIYEFSDDSQKGSALSAVLSLLKGRIGVSIGGTGSGDSLRINAGGIDAVFSVLDTDTRFRYVARPKVLAKDGQAATFFAGEDKRVTGALVLDKSGNPIQSKETLSAGVSLEVTPRIRGDVVDLAVHEAVSSFVSSGSGDPSILKRDLQSALVMQPGAVYVIGGLQASRTTGDKSGLFGFRTRSADSSTQTEIVLLLSVSRDAVIDPQLSRAKVDQDVQ